MMTKHACVGVVGYFLLGLSLLFVGASSDEICDLTGHWTSNLEPHPASIVRIEIVQDSDGAITVHATPWGDVPGHGQVGPGHNVSLLMVGASKPSHGIIKASPYKDPSGKAAPDCTFISFGWCRYPSCPNPDPPGSFPTCAVNGTACPAPTWSPQWALNLSTCCQPGGNDYFVPPVSQPWGLISLDWSVAKEHWLAPNRNESTCEATSTYGAKMIKHRSPHTRVMIYHNMELALQWLESQRAVMYDTSKADWFLQYTDGKGNKNGTIYNERRDEGDQFFWDFRNGDATDYFISSIVKTTDNEWVDGSFTDDVQGLPAEHPKAIELMKLSSSEVAYIQYKTQETSGLLIDALVHAGKYNWQAFGAGDGVAEGVTKATCLAFMRARCHTSQRTTLPVTMQMDDNWATQSVAAFLITRTPHSWLGWGWMSHQSEWNPIFMTDVGVPQGDCEEKPSGVFRRVWSKGVAELDCNTWHGSLMF